MKNTLLLVLMTVYALSWEVNTHRAIDRIAIEINLKNGGLHTFVVNSNIDKKYKYINENFETYGMSYYEYIRNGEKGGISDLNQTFSGNNTIQDAIEIGTMLEDAQWQNNALFGANGRFLNHFYNPQDGGDGLWWNANAVDWAKGLVSVGHLTDNEKRRIS